jgi:hypothetical protein
MRFGVGHAPLRLRACASKPSVRKEEVIELNVSISKHSGTTVNALLSKLIRGVDPVVGSLGPTLG